MRKLLFQGLVSVGIFFGTWFLLMQVNWIRILHIQKATDKVQEELGDLFWDVFKQNDPEIKKDKIVNAVDSIILSICKANQIDYKKIKLHILQKNEINAFALPNGHLIVYSGLLLNSDNAEQLAGVLGHEIAHIELDHVMKKLANEIGLSVLFSLTTGNKNPELVKQIAKTLSSTAFERKMEKQADIQSVDYLTKASINPLPFADFLLKLSAKDSPVNEYLSWISTHPDSKERAAYINNLIKNKNYISKPIISKATWNLMKKEIH
jgi:predicted Zn-dependent protease